jgi:putative aminopeptidase FrvX
METSCQMTNFLSTFQQLAAIPTAPYREHWLLHALDRILAEIPGLSISRDRWGNVAARLRRGDPASSPVAFVAHLDHPGFVVTSVEGTEVVATFEGGVDNSFFAGTPVRLFRRADDSGLRATIEHVSEREEAGDRNRVVRLRTQEDAKGWCSACGIWYRRRWRWRGTCSAPDPWMTSAASSRCSKPSAASPPETNPST